MNMHGGSKENVLLSWGEHVETMRWERRWQIVWRHEDAIEGHILWDSTHQDAACWKKGWCSMEHGHRNRYRFGRGYRISTLTLTWLAKHVPLLPKRTRQRSNVKTRMWVIWANPVSLKVSHWKNKIKFQVIVPTISCTIALYNKKCIYIYIFMRAMSGPRPDLAQVHWGPGPGPVHGNEVDETREWQAERMCIWKDRTKEAEDAYLRTYTPYDCSRKSWQA